MLVKDAAAILAEMAEKYPDYNLTVFAGGQHHTRKLMFYAIAPRIPGPYKYEEKADKEVFEEVSPVKQLANLRKCRVPDGVYDDPPF